MKVACCVVVVLGILHHTSTPTKKLPVDQNQWFSGYKFLPVNWPHNIHKSCNALPYSNHDEPFLKQSIKIHRWLSKATYRWDGDHPKGQCFNN